MNQQERFDQALNESLDRLFKGQSIYQVLTDYPEQAKELEPLLRTWAASRAFSKVQPRIDFKARAKYEFMAAARGLEAQPERLSFFKWRWQSAWAISLVTVAVGVLVGGSTVMMSSSSMPGETLYSVKLATENIHLALTTSDLAKAELNAE
jgi:hypothetical protein